MFILTNMVVESSNWGQLLAIRNQSIPLKIFPKQRENMGKPVEVKRPYFSQSWILIPSRFVGQENYHFINSPLNPLCFFHLKWNDLCEVIVALAYLCSPKHMKFFLPTIYFKILRHSTLWNNDNFWISCY